MLAKNGDILIAGPFSTFDGQPRRGIARLHGDGTLKKARPKKAALQSQPATRATSQQARMTAISGSPEQFLRSYFTAKQKQARELAKKLDLTVAPEVWAYFDAGARGDWKTVTNLWSGLSRRSGQYEGSKFDPAVHTPVWACMIETILARDIFAAWGAKYAVKFGMDIIESIPPGSIYFGGTDQGRGLVTALCESHADGKPFFTLTQNALVDGSYLRYLRAMYAEKIYVPTDEEVKKAFDEYLADARRRFEHDTKFPNEPKQVRPGEDIRIENGQVAVQGPVAVMNMNGLLAKVIFDKNPDREFFIEESFLLDWMYPHLTPHGLIMKINRKPLETLSPELIERDQKFWETEVADKIGDWLHEDTTVSNLCAFIEKVFVNRDWSAFKGDREFVGRRDAPGNYYARTAYSKLRSAIGGVYAWRAFHCKDSQEQQRMLKAADYAFRQAVALDPTTSEPLFRYVPLLVSTGRLDDAALLAKACRKGVNPIFAPEIDNLIAQLEAQKKQAEPRKTTQQ